MKRSAARSAMMRAIGEAHYDKLRRLRRWVRRSTFGLRYNFMKTLRDPQLPEIGKYHGTDKGDESHTFMGLSALDVYEKYFRPLRDDALSVLEIGVKDGASLKLWQSYFKNGEVYGIDIDPACKQLEGGRIRVEVGSQDDLDFLGSCFGETTRYDIIIDDGSHINSFTIASFEFLFRNRLNPGGIYIIEDLACSYQNLQTEYNILDSWPGMKYNDPSKTYDNDRKDMDDFFLAKIKALDHLQGDIVCLHFWARTCVIIKA